ncbi:RICIN domain-containing protein [Lysobacter silvisoli]|uniref:RICIN domain-containing protein n=1 Tax=Lysobacter silvisoli TaxID=2293254 RepID=UPI001314BF5A|nr:RICIN domain-containing protein [Lysobacter silvisoli]
MSVTAPAATEPVTQPALPGQCVDAGDPARGGSLTLAACNGAPGQNFQFDRDSATLRLPQTTPVRCLDLEQAPRNGVAVQTRECNGSASQRWAFPFDGRLRPVGVDPNKCLTHGTRPGKPPTGWVADVELLDPGCEFPEVGGGGFCQPSYAIHFEMSLASCDGRPAQNWRLAQAGFPFPPDGLGSRRVLVAVSDMHIDDCREGGACDWRVHCGLGAEADVEMVHMAEANTGGTLRIDRQLTHEGPLPVTVTCHVREFDRGIFDPDVWEVVGTTTRTFAAAGPGSMGMDNDEGKVTLNFKIEPVGVIQQPATVEAPPLAPLPIDAFQAMRYSGLDFSVPETDLRQWLANPQFTPYPSIAGALVRLFQGRRLARPVFLDVVVFNYEQGGGPSPRKLTDVDLARLARAVVEGHNHRYGESVSDVQTLLR